MKGMIVNSENHIYIQFPSSKLLNLFRASSDREQNLNLRLWGRQDSTIWTGDKQITIAVRLSEECRRKASLTSSLAHCSGSSCLLNPRRTRLTASWLDSTSQIPSQPMIKNSSSSVNVTT
ncbi:hypothetical protein V8G54_031488 [Vigna mungo]|uniref:Uncharacterized protein n=1 Tax=Vigna mungo TaxID=3915 RepID=A0AAQ3MK72_VIGMU